MDPCRFDDPNYANPPEYELVHCLECEHVWREKGVGEDCPNCGEDAQNTVYLTEGFD